MRASTVLCRMSGRGTPCPARGGAPDPRNNGTFPVPRVLLSKLRARRSARNPNSAVHGLPLTRNGAAMRLRRLL